MQTYSDSFLLYQKGFSVIINDFATPVEESTFYYFDYDHRWQSLNMSFPHFHNFYEMMILLSPKAQHSIAGKLYDIQNNDIVLLAPSVLHRTEFLSGPPSDRIIIDFLLPKQLLDTDLAYQELLSVFHVPLPVFRFAAAEQKVLFQPLNEVVQIASQDGNHNVKNMMIQNKFTEFLYLLWNLQKDNIYKVEPASEMEAKIQAITAYIHSHYEEDLSLDILAKEFYLSVYYLAHQFKAVTGYTVLNYIQLVRVRNAQHLLLNSTLRITEIAERTGFSSSSQFNRVFQKLCGLSPSEYREKRLTSFIF